MKYLHNFILVIPFFLSLSIIIRSQQSIDHICPNTTVFTRNSNYEINRDLTLSSLTSNGSRSIGFYNTSAGQGPNDVFGLFLCRGDVSIADCQNCVTSAAELIVALCPEEVEAVILYDKCLLGYSNESLADSPMMSYCSPNSTSDQTLFDSVLANSMGQAAEKAANARSGEKKFAVTEANLTASQTLYNLAQCTPDLSTDTCTQCLDTAISQLSVYCDGKEGGRVLSPSCNIRYEIYKFYNDVTALSEAPSPAAPSETPSPPPPEILAPVPSQSPTAPSETPSPPPPEILASEPSQSPTAPLKMPPPLLPGISPYLPPPSPTGSSSGIPTTTIVAIVASISVSVLLLFWS